VTLDQHISKCGRTGGFVSESPEYSFKLQIPGPNPRPTESESLSVGLEDKALYFILLIYFLVPSKFILQKGMFTFLGCVATSKHLGQVGALGSQSALPILGRSGVFRPLI